MRRSLNILLASSGRRPYLALWFKEALAALGVRGNVVVADSDANAAAQSVSDVFEVAPRLGARSYDGWLRQTLDRHEIGLAVSVNDYELARWAALPADERFSPLIRLDTRLQTVVEDKYQMALQLREGGVLVPSTVLARDLPRRISELGEAREVVAKPRFGSGSGGVHFADKIQLAAALDGAAASAVDRHGHPSAEAAADCVVVQSRVNGVEYGLDFISDLEGRYSSVLAREKISMRAGETDQAVSVDPGPFESLGRRIAELIPHRGLIDADVIRSPDGHIWLLDVNPRFGGGYPFSHLAGAKIPWAYVAWASGLPVEQDWLRSESGVEASKFVGIAMTGRRHE